MPRYFQLFRNTDLKTAVKFSEIDIELCKVVGAKVHPKNYVMGWYDAIGCRLAAGYPMVGKDENGRSLDEITKNVRENFQRPLPAGEEGRKLHEGNLAWADTFDKIIAYLRENYSSTAWYQGR